MSNQSVRSSGSHQEPLKPVRVYPPSETIFQPGKPVDEQTYDVTIELSRKATADEVEVFRQFLEAAEFKGSSLRIVDTTLPNVNRQASNIKFWLAETSKRAEVIKQERERVLGQISKMAEAITFD